MALDEGRLAVLRTTKLAALVTSLSGVPKDELTLPAPTAGIVGCVAQDRAYVLGEGIRDLGPALHWFSRQSATALTVLAEPDVAGDLARRAQLLTADIEVKVVEGAVAKPVAPTAALAIPELSAELWRRAAVMADAGISVVDDHGRLTGEVNGLEVARVEPSSSNDPSSEIELHIGVGEADRQLHGYIHGHLDDVEALRRAAATVAEVRRPGNRVHPLSRLARPRWIRSLLVADPAIAELCELEPQPPLRHNRGVFDTEPAGAYSRADKVTVVCSSGVDLDLIPEALDYRLRVDPDSRLLLVLPPRDVKLATRGLIDLIDNAQVFAFEPPW